MRNVMGCGLVLTLTGCVTTQGALTGAQVGEVLGKVLTGAPLPVAAAAPAADPRQGIRSIRETDLAGLFATKPLRMANGRNAQFPRVAISVEDHFVDRFNLPTPSQCYFMRARVWESAANSREVAPFTVCGQDIQQPQGGFQRADTSLVLWNSGILTAGEDHTGSTRTEGPRYPQRPLPHGPLDAVGISTSDIAYYFIHGTLTAMNFDFTQPDPRVWFVKFGKLDAAGFQGMRAAAQQPAMSAVKGDPRPHASGAGLPVARLLGASVTPSAATKPSQAPKSGPTGTQASGATSVAARSTPGPAMSYAAMLKIIGEVKGHVPTVRARLAGRSVQLTLKAPGPQSLVVDVADEIFFRCLQRATGFKSGRITAVITGYESSESGHGDLVILERCP